MRVCAGCDVIILFLDVGIYVLYHETSFSPPVMFLLTVPRPCFFCGSLFVTYVFVFSILPCLFLATLISPVGK